MTPILPCLAFADAEHTEQAVRYYVDLFHEVFGHAGELARTVFSQAEIDTVQRLHGLPLEQLPGPAGAVKTIRFHLNGMELLALNGGAYFGRFHETFSLLVNGKDQRQIDRLHARLADGGQVQPCGWVKDRFGVSWQIVPDFVLTVDEGPDQAAAQRMNVAILRMTRLDAETLKEVIARSRSYETQVELSYE
jgi:predicted 3-demethylubiquinone-9 3-methyltransferase (glyoxalase superfamily)